MGKIKKAMINEMNKEEAKFIRFEPLLALANREFKGYVKTHIEKDQSRKRYDFRIALLISSNFIDFSKADVECDVKFAGDIVPGTAAGIWELFNSLTNDYDGDREDVLKMKGVIGSGAIITAHITINGTTYVYEFTLGAEDFDKDGQLMVAAWLDRNKVTRYNADEEVPEDPIVPDDDDENDDDEEEQMTFKEWCRGLMDMFKAWVALRWKWFVAILAAFLLGLFI